MWFIVQFQIKLVIVFFIFDGAILSSNYAKDIANIFCVSPKLNVSIQFNTSWWAVSYKSYQIQNITFSGCYDGFTKIIELEERLAQGLSREAESATRVQILNEAFHFAAKLLRKAIIHLLFLQL